MNHPKGPAGRLYLARPLARTSPLLDQVSDSKAQYAGLRLAPEIQRTHGWLNSYVRFEPQTQDGSGVTARLYRLRAHAHGSSRFERVARVLGDRWTLVSPPVRAVFLRWYLG